MLLLPRDYPSVCNNCMLSVFSQCHPPFTSPPPLPADAGAGAGLTIDWPFLDLVTPRYQDKLEPLSDQQRKDFQFNRQTFYDAVIMPWYRNQDQPQVRHSVRPWVKVFYPKTSRGQNWSEGHAIH